MSSLIVARLGQAPLGQEVAQFGLGQALVGLAGLLVGLPGLLALQPARLAGQLLLGRFRLLRLPGGGLLERLSPLAHDVPGRLSPLAHDLASRLRLLPGHAGQRARRLRPTDGDIAVHVHGPLHQIEVALHGRDEINLRQRRNQARELAHTLRPGIGGLLRGLASPARHRAVIGGHASHLSHLVMSGTRYAQNIKRMRLQEEAGSDLAHSRASRIGVGHVILAGRPGGVVRQRARLHRVQGAPPGGGGARAASRPHRQG